ncbi:MAG: DUF3667 domain-containing protein [Sphingosinicella sp.]
MVSGIEGVGEAVTGGIGARAVEPQAGERTAGKPGTCLNCGTALAGPWCHACGQKGEVHRTIAGFWHDFLHGFLHFEGKIWRTLPLLAWRPGELTRRYIHGERALFVSPIALFLFSVFLMFAIFSLVGGPFAGSDPRRAAEMRGDLAAELDSARTRVARLERESASDPAVARELAEARSEVRAMEGAERLVIGPQPPRGTRREIDLREGEIDTGWLWLDRALEQARENPSLLFYKIQTNAYKFSWALIPISMPLVWLLFLHRRRYRQELHAYDPTVFVTYSIAFMNLLLVALSLVRPAFGDSFNALVLALYPPYHMYRQLKGAYGLTTFGAIWRTAFLLFFALIASLLFLLLLIAVGVLG